MLLAEMFALSPDDSVFGSESPGFQSFPVLLFEMKDRGALRLARYVTAKLPAKAASRTAIPFFDNNAMTSSCSFPCTPEATRCQSGAGELSALVWTPPARREPGKASTRSQES